MNTTRLTHDEYFLAMLRHVAARSTCCRRAVGAIIVDHKNKILATGYNGVPSGFKHCIDVPCEGANDEKGNTTRCMAVHAETNAIMQCHRPERACTIYVSCAPCFECAKMLVNTNITRVVCCEPYNGAGEAVLRAAGIELEVMHG